VRYTLAVVLLLTGCQSVPDAEPVELMPEKISITHAVDMKNADFINAFVEGNAADFSFSFNSLQTELLDDNHDALTALLERYPERLLVVFDVHAGNSKVYWERRVDTLKNFFLGQGRAVIVAPFQPIANRDASVWLINADNEKASREQIDYLIMEP